MITSIIYKLKILFTLKKQTKKWAFPNCSENEKAWICELINIF